MTVNFKINSLDEDSDSILLWLQKEMVTEFKCICSVILQNSVNHKLECVCFHVYGNNNFNALFMEGCVTASDKQGLNTLVANFLMHSAFVSQNQLFFFLRKWKWSWRLWENENFTLIIRTPTPSRKIKFMKI